EMCANLMGGGTICSRENRLVGGDQYPRRENICASEDPCVQRSADATKLKRPRCVAATNGSRPLKKRFQRLRPSLFLSTWAHLTDSLARCAYAPLVQWGEKIAEGSHFYAGCLDQLE